TADRRSAALRLRRLAPTVIASRSSRAALVDALRAMGYAPVAESLDGDVIISELDRKRTEGLPPARSVPSPNGLDAEVTAAAVRALRAGDAAHLTRREPTDAPSGQIARPGDRHDLRVAGGHQAGRTRVDRLSRLPGQR